jgi:hypothetical protein
MSTHSEALEDIKKAKDALDHVDASPEAVAHPDPKKHKIISFVKSGFRIVAGLALAGGGWLEMNPYIQAAGLGLVLAEILGIAEEMV